ncbi:RabGAP/TBC domain-containing protein [Heterostelium album PN500]|uniref:RabGAP/TBC domain-containing protein n=1 Tax=Heterostelium pallidum (strain ATCC 26659 / Pp 5 / PN500) TaxID=670386 RepID=D3B513_HETP5|nr:RabGAP/TBC domain-containing protein [Heterostelium album PN500]EFA83505.1 RabGAP/TBC domain-containing protein [Heterostelium album PN500]|eukprot:XP_020435622.1 RabGAP/TBC domain-containing protein [Heterostelium album PN500]
MISTECSSRLFTLDLQLKLILNSNSSFLFCTGSLSQSQLAAAAAVGASSTTTSPNTALRKKYLDLIEYGNKHYETTTQNLYQLRKTILLEGLPPETEEEIEDRRKDSPRCSLRGLVWKILLGIKECDAEKYIELLKLGSSDQYQKIRKDISRTFMKDALFCQAVSQDKLSRCLNAFVHMTSEIKSNLNYVQGMNAICGAFLYVLPELDAFYCFQQLVLHYCHLYLVPKISGVHTALNILDTILEFVDPELYGYLKTRSYDPVLLTHAILSLGTSTPPLGELLHLWDFYFAFGIHLNVICTIAQLLLMRDTLLAHPSPCSLFRSLPELDSETIINLSIHIVRQLPDDLYDLLVDHPIADISSQDEFV